MIKLILIIWYISGIVSSLYLFKKFNLIKDNLDNLFIYTISGISGIFSFLIGYYFLSRKRKIYKFMYNPMTEESGLTTISIHRTKESALKAMNDHKNFKYKEYLDEIEYYKKEYGDKYDLLAPQSKFGQFEYWCVEVEILKL